MSLLAMTQDILSDMDSDDVNSINDSVEALQVAQIIKSSYYNIIDSKDYAFLYEMFKMDASASISKPTHMKLPEDVIDLKWVKYNNLMKVDARDIYQKIEYKYPEDFSAIVDQRDSTADNVKKVEDYTGVSINVFTDKGPTYYTSFDDENIVFDSYNKELDDTLKNSKTKCFGKRSVPFVLDDTFVPDLPIQMFTYLLNEAKSACFLTLKQIANQKAEQTSVTQRRRLSQEAWKVTNGIRYPNYGRKR